MEWIIVDDGSTDETSRILDRYAREIAWIRVHRREDRGHRTTGGGVEAFLDGYQLLERSDWDFLVNLDADLTFSIDYFAKLFELFRNDPELGIAGGTIYDQDGDQLQLDKSPTFHVRGGTKIYRRECWEMLGGLHRGLGWDTLDEVKANQLGWKTRTFPELKLIHHRVTGGVWGTWGNAVKDGEANYIAGYHPVFMGTKCVLQLFRSPYIVRSAGLAYGFVLSALRGAQQTNDASLKRYLRLQQLRRLFGMKSIWK